MDIEAIEEAANTALFDHLSVPALVTHPGDLSQEARIIIDRNATITDEYGAVLESRCEIGLEVCQVGGGDRGTLVDTGKPDDQWRLLEPIGNDGWESRWTAGKA